MGVVTYTTDALTLRSDWKRENNQKPATLAEGVRTFNVTGIPLFATVQSAVLSFDLSGAAYGLNSNYKLCTAYGQNVSNTDGTAQLQSVRVELRENRTIDIVFQYQAFEYSGTIGQSYYRTVTFGSVTNPITLTITFDEGEDPGYRDDETLIPVKGVSLYPPKTTDFSKNGIALQPVSCVVSEDAGGSYELQMQHPMDKEDRWMSILEDYIIKAPVPPFKIPEVTMPVGKIWQVKSSVEKTPLYKTLPTYSKADPKSTDNPDPWDADTYYTLDSGNVVHEGLIHQAVVANKGQEPGHTTGYWATVAEYHPTKDDPGTGTGVYNPGVIIVDLVSEAQISFIATYNWKYTQVRDSLGHIGYVLTADIEETQTAADPYTIPARTIYTQLFRVYSVSCDEAEGMVTVSARHISYDFEANGIFDCQMTEAEPATAIALLQGRLMNDDDRLIACPIDYPKITADWSFGNPIQALLDPDEGFAAQVQGKILRDNKDFFILPSTPARIGARLAYGVNLTGVTWERNLDELVTRIIPRAGDGQSGFIYLDELFVDSPYINEYAVVHTEVLDSEYSVGQEIELADGTKRTLSRSEVIERMRQEAENRYYVDGADKVVISLDVEFVLLGDTEEFKQYRNLQRVNLYDKIQIDTGNMTTTAQVIGYEWDCLMSRYNSISIGKVYSMGRKRLPGYRVATGAITYSKLSPGLIKWIRGSV